MPQSDCLITAVAPSVPSPVMATPKLSGRVVPWSVRSPSTRRLSPSACTDFDSKLISSPFSTSLSTVCSISVFCASLSAWTPPLPSSTRSDPPSALISITALAGSSPTTSTASQEVTWNSRLWPAMAAAPVLCVRTESVPSSGPSAYLPAGIATAKGYLPGLTACPLEPCLERHDAGVCLLEAPHRQRSVPGRREQRAEHGLAGDPRAGDQDQVGAGRRALQRQRGIGRVADVRGCVERVGDGDTREPEPPSQDALDDRRRPGRRAPVERRVDGG